VDAPRREADSRSGALWLGAAALLTAVLFANGSLDMAAARWFYEPAGVDHWPLARQQPWSVLYRAAPWLTAGLVVLGFAALGVGLARRRGALTRSAAVLLLAVTIGPGLLDNALFKDHWQHPRPRELSELGGAWHYVPTPLIGSEGGASFPCGHCSVGFLYAAGLWIWRRRRPRWAGASLACGLALGVLLGLGRMAAGAHFLSDVIWSALIAFGVVHVLWYHVLPERELPAEGLPAGAATRPPATGVLRGRAQRVATGAALLGGAAVLLALFVLPHGTTLEARVPLDSLLAPAPRILEVDADAADIEVVLIDGEEALSARGELHGFGLPGSHLGARFEILPQPPPRLRYRIESRGWLTDVDGFVTLRVPAAGFEKIVVNVGRGSIRVSDTTRSGVVRSNALRLELHTRHGAVQSP
jgi:membrane-associated PAP2 superfamily phosphatase